jgi:hypothetical protein
MPDAAPGFVTDIAATRVVAWGTGPDRAAVDVT